MSSSIHRGDRKCEEKVNVQNIVQLNGIESYLCSMVTLILFSATYLFKNRISDKVDGVGDNDDHVQMTEIYGQRLNDPFF
jgi:hypothetical protein